jgi:hypothetical protein
MKALLLALIAAGSASAETHGEAQGASLDRITACIERPDAPAWAGSYSARFDEHGRDEQLELCTDGFDFRSMHERENGWDPSFGTVERLADDRFLLRSVDRSRERLLRLIHWDRCTFAVFEDQMLDFINKANGSWTGAVEQIPSRCVETKAERYKRLKGYPDLPPQWRDFQLKQEIVAAVTSVEAYRPVDNERVYYLKISAGRKAGLRPGFGIWLFCADGVDDAQFSLTWSAENESEAKLVQYDPAKKFDGKCVPKVGQKVSSRIPKHAWEKNVSSRK